MQAGPVICTVAAVTSAARAGVVLHVDDDAPPGGDGLSWTTPYRFRADTRESAQPIRTTETSRHLKPF